MLVVASLLYFKTSKTTTPDTAATLTAIITSNQSSKTVNVSIDDETRNQLLASIDDHKFTEWWAAKIKDTGTVTSVMDNLKSKVESKVNDIATGAQKLVSKTVPSVMDTLKSKVESKVNDIATGAQNLVSKRVPSVIDTVRNKAESAINIVSGSKLPQLPYVTYDVTAVSRIRIYLSHIDNNMFEITNHWNSSLSLEFTTDLTIPDPYEALISTHKNTYLEFIELIGYTPRALASTSSAKILVGGCDENPEDCENDDDDDENEDDDDEDEENDGNNFIGGDDVPPEADRKDADQEGDNDDPDQDQEGDNDDPDQEGDNDDPDQEGDDVVDPDQEGDDVPPEDEDEALHYRGCDDLTDTQSALLSSPPVGIERKIDDVSPLVKITSSDIQEHTDYVDYWFARKRAFEKDICDLVKMEDKNLKSVETIISRIERGLAPNSNHVFGPDAYSTTEAALENIKRLPATEVDKRMKAIGELMDTFEMYAVRDAVSTTKTMRSRIENIIKFARNDKISTLQLTNEFCKMLLSAYSRIKNIFLLKNRVLETTWEEKNHPIGHIYVRRQNVLYRIYVPRLASEPFDSLYAQLLTRHFRNWISNGAAPSKDELYWKRTPTVTNTTQAENNGGTFVVLRQNTSIWDPDTRTDQIVGEVAIKVPSSRLNRVLWKPEIQVSNFALNAYNSRFLIVGHEYIGKSPLTRTYVVVPSSSKPNDRIVLLRMMQEWLDARSVKAYWDGTEDKDVVSRRASFIDRLRQMVPPSASASPRIVVQQIPESQRTTPDKIDKAESLWVYAYPTPLSTLWFSGNLAATAGRWSIDQQLLERSNETDYVGHTRDEAGRILSYLKADGEKQMDATCDSISSYWTDVDPQPATIKKGGSAGSFKYESESRILSYDVSPYVCGRQVLVGDEVEITSKVVSVVDFRISIRHNDNKCSEHSNNKDECTPLFEDTRVSLTCAHTVGDVDVYVAPANTTHPKPRSTSTFVFRVDVGQDRVFASFEHDVSFDAKSQVTKRVVASGDGGYKVPEDLKKQIHKLTGWSVTDSRQPYLIQVLTTTFDSPVSKTDDCVKRSILGGDDKDDEHEEGPDEPTDQEGEDCENNEDEYSPQVSLDVLLKTDANEYVFSCGLIIDQTSLEELPVFFRTAVSMYERDPRPRLPKYLMVEDEAEQNQQLVRIQVWPFPSKIARVLVRCSTDDVTPQYCVLDVHVDTASDTAFASRLSRYQKLWGLLRVLGYANESCGDAVLCMQSDVSELFVRCPVTHVPPNRLPQTFTSSNKDVVVISHKSPSEKDSSSAHKSLVITKTKPPFYIHKKSLVISTDQNTDSLPTTSSRMDDRLKTDPQLGGSVPPDPSSQDNDVLLPSSSTLNEIRSLQNELSDNIVALRRIQKTLLHLPSDPNVSEEKREALQVQVADIDSTIDKLIDSLQRTYIKDTIDRRLEDAGLSPDDNDDENDVALANDDDQSSSSPVRAALDAIDLVGSVSRRLTVKDVTLGRFTSQLVAVMVLKQVRMGLQLLALEIAQRTFEQAYMSAVHVKQDDPPHITSMLMIFVAYDVAFQVGVLTVLFLIWALFTGRGDGFILDVAFFADFILDGALTTTLLLLMGWIVAENFWRKRYFQYKYQGIGTTRAFRDVLRGWCVILSVVPLYVLF